MMAEHLERAAENDSPAAPLDFKAAGVTGRLFDVSDLVNLLIESERKRAA